MRIRPVSSYGIGLSGIYGICLSPTAMIFFLNIDMRIFDTHIQLSKESPGIAIPMPGTADHS